MNALNAAELPVLDALSVLYCGFLDFISQFFSLIDEGGAIWIALAVVFLFFKKTRKTGVMLAVALTLGLLIANCALKPLVGRVRPYDVNPAARLIVERYTDFSFPSGHAVSCVECATVLLIRDRRFGIPFAVYALIVCFARLYLYVHYPTDVLFGVLLGVAVGIVSVLLIERLVPVYEKYLEKRRGKSGPPDNP